MDRHRGVFSTQQIKQQISCLLPFIAQWWTGSMIWMIWGSKSELLKKWLRAYYRYHFFL
jgi:hypothetical protein